MSAAIWTVRRAKRDLRAATSGYTASRHILRLTISQAHRLGWKLEITPRG